MNHPSSFTDQSPANPSSMTITSLELNHRRLDVSVNPADRLSAVLRDELGLTGTKIGCHAGDCGICTVLLDDRQVCACLVPAAQVDGTRIITVEGLARLVAADGRAVGARLQRAFALTGAAQCGICSPGMLMAAASLLLREPAPTIDTVRDAIGGVLCRCTGYQKIVEAILLAGGTQDIPLPIAPVAGQAVGARLERLDGQGKLDGSQCFGADQVPAGAVSLRVIRSPYARARIELGDLDGFVAARPGLTGWIGPRDIPNNRFSIFAELRDQPALADHETRFRGEAVIALLGSPQALSALQNDPPPVEFFELTPLLAPAEALADGARAVQARYPDNILCMGRVSRGDAASMGESIMQSVSGELTTTHVEHAYLEPEAGHAIWHGPDHEFTVTLFVTTQTPYLDRDEIAFMFDLEPARVRIMPSAVGGGFGGKLDLSVQPLLVAAARKSGLPVCLVFERPESMLASTKRHPAHMRARLDANAQGRFLAYRFDGDFNTGPYASWGPTVANRVPIHACGPYRFEAVTACTRAVLTNDAISGAFRGFGVPQSTLLVEMLIDELAIRLNQDPLRLRLANAIRAGDRTATGQQLNASVGLVDCLQRLQPAWQAAQEQVAAANQRFARAGGSALPGGSGERRNAPADPHGLDPRAVRQGVGIACMWYGIGNTVIANPSTMTVGLRANGRLMLYNGAVDIGQGTYTILPQICADALGVPVTLIDQVFADTGRTSDAGKSSASRQTFVSGSATRLAGLDLRRQLCERLGVSQEAPLTIGDGWVKALTPTGGCLAHLDLASLPTDGQDDVLRGQGYFDPPTVALDAEGQGVPYATYGFAAQFAVVEVDIELGTVRVLQIHAAHDVGRAINPVQVEGQIHGGIAQGLGMALMEAYRSGQTDNLHDYLIPTVGDMPAITVHLIEACEPLGPWGAKGVGEPALVATAPAILNAIRHATGVRLDELPVTPDRLLAAIEAQGADHESRA